MKGRSWELLLESEHDRYRKTGQAVVHKAEPRRDRTGKFIGKAPPDYLGTLHGGRSVVFDAKDCETQRFPLSRIKKHQAQDLEACWKAGGCAFIALRIAANKGDPPSRWRRYVAPWSWLQKHYKAWRRKTGDASISLTDLRLFAHEFDGGDWLSAALMIDARALSERVEAG